MNASDTLIIHDVGIEAEDVGFGLLLPHMRWIYTLLVIPLVWIPLTRWVCERLTGNAQGEAMAIAGFICGLTFFIIGSGCTWCTIEVTATEFKFSSWAGAAVWQRADIDTVEVHHKFDASDQRTVTDFEVVFWIFIPCMVVFLLTGSSHFWFGLAGILFFAGGIPHIHRYNRGELDVRVSRKQAGLLEPRTIAVRCKRDQAQSLAAALRSDHVTSSDSAWMKRLTDPVD
ncbi:MAG: hypothetical protein HY870_04345 [Chloroflexi bacterium]|nr:hypothetical protein [Chloroflexota bacterium]